MKIIPAILAALTVALLAAPAAALHQGSDPSINCVAIIYDDFTFENVSWADVADLGRRLVIEMRVIHDTGASAGPGAVTFTGFDAYALFMRGPNLLARSISPSAGGGSSNAREKLFIAAGIQGQTITMPTGTTNTAGVGATANFTSIDTGAATYADDQETAAAIDVGFCTP